MAQGISIPVVQSGLEASIQQGVKNVGSININASVDPSAFKNLAQPLGRVSGLATEFEKSIAASNARVLAFGASVGIINGVQNAFSALVTTGIQVQKTLADIAAISGKSGQELSKFGDSLFEIGKMTGQTFQTASQAALEFSRQGLNVEQTLKRTSDALTLTRFTTLSASEAVDVLTAAANSFTETGITTAQIINKLIAVDSKFAVSAEDLAKGLARAGSIAQEVGVNFDELNAAITVAQERTARGGAVIGNALKTIFTSIRSDQTIKALQEVGIFSKDAAGNLKPALGLLTELAGKIDQFGGQKKIELLESVASKYNINILSALLKDLQGADSKFSQAVQVSAGASNEAYVRQIELNKTLSAEINKVSVSTTQLLNKLAEIGVTDSLSNLLKFVGNLVDGFNDLLNSESIGGDIAKSLIKGLSSVFFTVGLPILAAIFVKLTTDIAKFGVESLKTILGINQQVRERQALEQAVVNTLIRDQEVMASILSLSGNRAKQEEYLLGVYNRQLTALQQVQNIASSVTPALMAGGLSATSGQVKKRGAGGYLPAQEAADVRRGVGGASSSSKVVSIPNFAFGGGKRGTMVANTSEYVVPNFANGGSAIFNQDMARAYGLPAGAKKISAAGGYVPNFNRYVYDSDRIEPDKNSLLKAILASKAKKNLIVGPAGSGKSTYGASLGSFITSPNQLADATEIDVLSGAARTKDGGTSKNFQQIADAVNSSGGKISYLYAGNMDILSRRRGRIGTGPDEGDLRSKKQIAGSMYAPLNQFDFISKVKSSAKNFEMIRGAKGYVPNFAEKQKNLIKESTKYAGLFAQERLKDGGKKNQLAVINPSTGRASLVNDNKIDKDGVNLIVRSFPAKSNAQFGDVDSIRKEIEEDGQNFAVKYASEFAKAFNPDAKLNIKAIKERAKQANMNKGAVQAFVGTTFEAGVSGLLEGEDFNKSQERSATSPFDFQATAEIRKAFNIPKEVEFIETKNENNSSNIKSIAEKIYRVEKSKGTANEVSALKDRSFDYLGDASRKDGKRKARAYIGKKDGLLYIEKQLDKFEATSERPTVSEINDRNLQFGSKKYERTPARSAFGYIPNFAQGGPLEDAIQREMAAGLDPSQIRITKDGKLKNSQNPNGFAVINTRDEPNGKVPNFARDGEEWSVTGTPAASQLNIETATPRKFNPTNVTATELLAQKTGVPTANPKGAKEFDAGKFLAFQTAVSGASAAASSFAEQGSAAANVIEGIGAVAQVASTAILTIGTTMVPWVKVLTIGVTALAAFAPMIMKYSGSLESATDRTSKALAKLAEEAQKTGRAVTPEQFLAAFETEQKKTEQKTSADSATKQIEASLKGFSGVDDSTIKTILASLSASGNIDKGGEVNKRALGEIITGSTTTRMTGAGMYGAYAQKYLGKESVLEQGKDMVLKNQAASLTKVEQVKKSDNALQSENAILNLGLGIRKNIFDAEIAMGRAQAGRALKADEEVALLERRKGILTETAYAQEQSYLEMQRGRDERTKAEEGTSVDLMKSLQGVTDSKLGNVLGQLNQTQTSAISSQFQNGGFDTQEFRDVFKKETGVNFNELAKESRDSVVKSLGTASEGDKSAEEQYYKAIDAARQKLSLLQTETQKITQSTGYLNEELKETALGQLKYAERLGSATAKLAETEAQQAVNNKLELDMADKKFSSDMKMIQGQIDFEKAMRDKIPIEKRAAKFALELGKTTNEKIDQIKKEALASQDKYVVDLELAAVENEAYETYLNLIGVTEEVTLENEKQILVSAKARRSAEVLAVRQGEIFAEEGKILKDKIKIAQAFNDQVGIEQLANKVALELIFERENLIKSSRELSARQMNMAGELSNNQEKTRQGAGGELLGIMTNGNIGRAGFAGDTRLAEVVKERTGGRDIGKMGIGQIDAVKKEMTIGERMYVEGGKLQDQAQTFQQIIGDQTPKMFADGMAQAMEAALNQSENLGQALNGIAMGFLKTLQGAFLQSASNQIVASLIPKPYAKGGVVSGGSGYRDDVPAMLTGGEFVMRKSAVQKYGVSNLERMNSGGMFVPGTRGGGAISGDEALRAFANQSTTSGATDALKGSRSSAFINLEDESQKLSRYALLGDDTISQEVRGAKMQAFDILKNKSDFEKQQKEAEKQQKKALVRQMIGTVAAGALSYGAGKMKGPKSVDVPVSAFAPESGDSGSVALAGDKYSMASMFKRTAYGGMIRRYASGGPTDDIPAMLMSGEYVMNRGASRKYGKQFLDSMNQGRAPRFADGGEAAPSSPTTTTESNAKGMGDVSININVTGQTSQTETQGNSSQGGIDYKKMSEKIKMVVMETLNEEKRLGGSLRTR